jgi:hypothetical protein
MKGQNIESCDTLIDKMRQKPDDKTWAMGAL